MRHAVVAIVLLLFMGSCGNWCTKPDPKPKPKLKPAASTPPQPFNTNCWDATALTTCQHTCTLNNDCCDNSAAGLGCTAHACGSAGICTYSLDQANAACTCMPGECSPDGKSVCGCTVTRGAITASQMIACTSDYPTCDAGKRRCVCDPAMTKCADSTHRTFCNADGNIATELCPAPGSCDPATGRCKCNRTCGAPQCGKDNCVDCGSCPGGQTCNPNNLTCCKPATCDTLAPRCGTLSDGCGGPPLNCTNCASGTCVNGTCCVPTTTCVSGTNCGSMADGCGHPLDCGPCDINHTCIHNQCQGQCGPGQTQTCLNCGLQACQNDGTWGGCINSHACSANSSSSCNPAYTAGGCPPGTGTMQCSQSCDWGTCTATPQVFSVDQNTGHGVDARAFSEYGSGQNCGGSTQNHGPWQVCPTGSVLVADVPGCKVDNNNGSCLRTTGANAASTGISVTSVHDCFKNANAHLVVRCIPINCSVGS